ncbi:hypothetical protein MX031_22170, partial [Ralstonia solanacearum]|nr:hypothetical protein [Ralstonia solanacearum]MCM2263134.1 hypothetical protein [Ralstonia solanacearum]
TIRVNLNHALNTEILTLPLVDNPEIWRAIAQRYTVDLFCGLFMKHGNEGFSLSPASLLALGLRHVEIGFDLYGPDDDSPA